MGKIEEAIKKINTEIQKQPANRYLALVGEHIIDCITTESAADAVLKEGKTLAGVMQAIRSEASKQKVGNMAVIEDAVVYGWAEKYFGLDKPQAKEPPKKKGICLDFNDFL